MILDARSRRIFFSVLLAVALPLAAAARGRDGRLFDPGARMSERAPKAPPELDQAAFLIGEWDVACSRSGDEGEVTPVRGAASITYMNRGHGVMERFVSEDGGDGHPAYELRLLVFNPAGGVWSYGEASSWTESTRAMSGPPTPGAIVLADAVRPRGGPTLELHRRTMTAGAGGTFTTTEDVSTDLGETWRPRLTCGYTPRGEQAPSLVPSDDLGAPAPGRPEAAAGFDFLLGEHDARHWLLFQGREVRFPSTTTAVYALGGYGILEFDRLDVDPGLPDAGTTVVRLYNRAQRRWESLFVNNRFNSILRFGGRRDGERIVLTNFAVDSTGPFPRFVFHDIGDHGYSWYAERSSDRGETFEKTWTIDVSYRNGD
jgi:hypothetical protein